MTKNRRVFGMFLQINDFVKEMVNEFLFEKYLVRIGNL